MTLADEIRKDREAGTPGPWIPEDSPRYCTIYISPKYGAGMAGRMAVADVGYEDAPTEKEKADARRIARLPDLEDKYLRERHTAAKFDKWLTHEIEVCKAAGDRIGAIAYTRALNAYRKAVEEG